MNTSQRLADIQGLLQYVKGVLDTPANHNITKTLDDIGQMTLALVDNLRSLDTAINTSQKEALASHTNRIVDISQHITDKLTAIQQSLSDIDSGSKERVEEIRALCHEYEELSKQCVDTYTEQSTALTDTLEAIHKTNNQSAQQIKKIQSSLINKEYLDGFANNITGIINTLMKQDKEADEYLDKALYQLTARIDDTANELKGIGQQLQAIDNGFQTTMGRLNVLDVKLDAIAEVVTGNE